jgi:hypothetical protein
LTGDPKNPSFLGENRVEQRGIEPGQPAEITTICDDSRQNNGPRVDVSARELVTFGPPDWKAPSVDEALAGALARAAAAGRWDVVAQLAHELEARRLAKPK